MDDTQKEIARLRALVEQMSQTVDAMKPVHDAIMKHYGGIQDTKALYALRRVLFDHWCDQEGNVTRFTFRK